MTDSPPSSTRPWVVALIFLTGILIAMQWTWRSEEREPRVGPSPNEVAAARWVLALKELGALAQQPELGAQLASSLKQPDETDDQKLRRAIVEVELREVDDGVRVIESVPEAHPDREPLLRRYRGEEVTEREQAGIEARHGWFGELSAVYALEDDDPKREAFFAPVKRSARMLGSMPLLGLGGFLAGAILFGVFISRVRRGTLTWRFPRQHEGSADLPWLKIVVVFLLLAVLASLGIFAMLGIPAPIAIWILALPVFLPLVQGMPFAQWRAGLGLTGGAQAIGRGFIGYLAGLPVIAVGFWITNTLVQVTGMSADHPISEELGSTSMWLILINAVVWAPLVEELVFRGAFYRFLRPTYRVVGASVLSGLLFAVLHPQGFTGVPAILSVGIVLGVIREWSGSTVSCITAHAMHNGAIVMLMVALFA